MPSEVNWAGVALSSASIVWSGSSTPLTLAMTLIVALLIVAPSGMVTPGKRNPNHSSGWSLLPAIDVTLVLPADCSKASSALAAML